MIAAHEATGGPAFELYGLGLEHKHVPELQRYALLTRRPIFVPSVGHSRQGMLVSVPLHLDTLPGRPIARPHGARAATPHAPWCASWTPARTIRQAGPEGAERHGRDGVARLRNPAHGHAVLVARLDNLGKGASGAAVQNMRLMLGLDAVQELALAE